jgi:hypothetical protein
MRPEFVGDDVGERRLAQAGRAVEQHVIERLAARLGGLDGDSRLSLTLSCPMNSRRRCGRSFSSKDESSSTGAAETMRSFNTELSFVDTEGDGSSSGLRVAS